MRVGGYVGSRIPDVLQTKSTPAGAIASLIQSSSQSSSISSSSVATALVTMSRMSYSVTVKANGSIVTPTNISTAISQSSFVDALVSLIESSTIGYENLADYSGDLAVGDVLEIDSEKLLVTKNGSNARKNYEGDYPILELGDRTLFYFDSEDSRTVEIEIIKEDKHI